MQTLDSHEHQHQPDPEYDMLLERVAARIQTSTKQGTEPLFTTFDNAVELWKAYIRSFPLGAVRQLHTCQACRQFIQHFGGLATIKNGHVNSALWNVEDADDFYKPTVAALAQRVYGSAITGVFYTSEKKLGTPVTGPWRHFAAIPPASCVNRSKTKSDLALMAEKAQDFIMISRALAEFSPKHLGIALQLLRGEALYRSEKILGQVEWLFLLQEALHSKNSSIRRNTIIWEAVAIAPEGFCHPRAGMVGTLLEDIAAGYEYKTIAEKFAAKMSPILYQRPQAAPSEGTIAQANSIIQKLEAEGSLARRFLRVDEVKALWRPASEKKARTTHVGIFSDVQTRGKKKKKQERERGMVATAINITWDKFYKTVLPTVDHVEIWAPHMSQNYVALVTAVNPDAPPIIQWDREGARNPVSWYFWHGGAYAESFNLTPDKYHEVVAIALKPSMWGLDTEEMAHQGQGVVFVISGARETRTGAGAALFPEILKSEFHGIRSVIEAYSRSSKIEGRQDPHAAGMMFHNSGGSAGKVRGWDCRVRVYIGGVVMQYNIDRWD
jgi:hypothetical protein